MKQADLVNSNGDILGKIDLPDSLFSTKVNPYLIHEAFIAQRASSRRGTASTKTRADVSGGGCKPWRQKGTGRARVGSIRNPVWRGGGVAFGPHPRSYNVPIPKKKKRAAIKQLLTSKAEEGKIKVIDEVKIEGAKTRMAYEVLKKNKLDDKKTIIVIDKMEEILKKAIANLSKAKLIIWKDLNVIDLISFDYILISKAALEEISRVED